MECKTTSRKYDILGITSSTLCLIHCLVPSFVLLGSHIAGDWMEHGFFDIIFFTISLFAVLTSSKHSSRLIKVLMWFALTSLGITMFFEHHTSMQILSYLAALSLIVAHILNLRRQFRPQLA